MEKLEKLNKLAPMFRDCIYQYQNVDLQALECANKARELMVDFALSLMENGESKRLVEAYFNEYMEEYETLDN